MVQITSPAQIISQILILHSFTCACAATTYRKFGLVAFDTGTPIHFASPVIRYSTGLVVLPGTPGASPSDYFSGMFLGRATDTATSTGIVQIYENSAYRLAVGTDGLLRVVQVAAGESAVAGDAVSGGDPAAGGAGTFAVAEEGNYFIAQGQSQFMAVKDGVSGDYLIYVGSTAPAGTSEVYTLQLITRYADIEQAITTLTPSSSQVATSSTIGFWNSTKSLLASSVSTGSTAETVTSGRSSVDDTTTTVQASLEATTTSSVGTTTSSSSSVLADEGSGQTNTVVTTETTQKGFAAGRGSSAALAVAVGLGALIL